MIWMRRSLQLLAILAITGCVGKQPFSKSTIRIDLAEIEPRGVEVGGDDLSVTFEFTNTNSTSVCFRKYDQPSGFYQPYVDVSDNFDPPPLRSPGTWPQSDFGIEQIAPGETSEFTAAGRYDGRRNALLKNGKFVVIFVAVPCAGGSEAILYRSRAFDFSEFHQSSSPRT